MVRGDQVLLREERRDQAMGSSNRSFSNLVGLLDTGQIRAVGKGASTHGSTPMDNETGGREQQSDPWGTMFGGMSHGETVFEGSDSAVLSPMQEQLWYLDELTQSSSEYHVPLVLHLRGHLEETALRESLHALVRRHPGLRTTFPVVEHKPVQEVHPATVDYLSMMASLAVEEVSAVSDEGTREQKARVSLLQFAWAPFDLARGPLSRTLLIRLAPEEHILVLVVHHIIADGWSVGILNRELAQLYHEACTMLASKSVSPCWASGESSAIPGGNSGELCRYLARSLPAPAMTYTAYTRLAQTPKAAETAERDLQYWVDALRDVPTTLEFPASLASDPQDRPVREAMSAEHTASRTGRRVPFAVSADVVNALAAIGATEGATPFMTLLTAFEILLGRYTGEEDFIVGVPQAHRLSPEEMGVVGHFVTTAPLRANLRDNPTFRALLRRNRAACLAAYAHQNVPFERLVQAVNAERVAETTPLVQAMFMYQNMPFDLPRLDALDVALIEIPGNSAKFDLTLELASNLDDVVSASSGQYPRSGRAAETSRGLSGVFEYRRDRFSARAVARMVGHWHTLLESIVANPECSVWDLGILTPEERYQLTSEWNATATAYPRDETVISLFEAQVRSAPNAQAVRCADTAVTYRELDVLSTELASFLREELHIGREEIVGLHVERSITLVVALLGILKAGAVYLPLDSTAPPERVAFMLSDAGCRVVLTQAHLKAVLESWQVGGDSAQMTGNQAAGIAASQAGSTVMNHAAERSLYDIDLVLDHIVSRFGGARQLQTAENGYASVDGLHSQNHVRRDGLSNESISIPAYVGESSRDVRLNGESAEPGVVIGPESAAYMMFTSGSTGIPKGVVIVHRGIIRLVRSSLTTEITPADTMLGFSPISFDPSTLEIWGALLNGACLVMCPPFPGGRLLLDELANLIEKEGITFATLVTAIFHKLVDHYLDRLHSLRQIVIGGEVLSPSHALRAARELPNCRIINAYGPTESTTVATYDRVDPGDEYPISVPIGRPLSNTVIYVLDRHQQMVPVGVPGELHIGGDGLAREYWHRPELTAERFIFWRRDAMGVTEGSRGLAGPGMQHTDTVRLYATGDVGYFDENGTLMLLGRRDTQIKLNGYRVELGEIEAALLAHPGIAQASVMVEELLPESGDSTDKPASVVKRVVAYVEIGDGDTPPSVDSIRRQLARRLPAHMVPTAITLVEHMPLTSNEKVDRRALQSLTSVAVDVQGSGGERRDRSQPAELPQTAGTVVTPTEAALIRIWERVLERTGVGINDNFFHVGGRSVQMTTVCLAVREYFGLPDLPLARVLTFPTLAATAAYLDQELQARGQSRESGSPSRDHMSTSTISGERIVPSASPVSSVHGDGLVRADSSVSAGAPGPVLPSGAPSDMVSQTLYQMLVDAQLPLDVRPANSSGGPLPYTVDPQQAQSVLVTGASGFLGAFLVDELLRSAPQTTIVCPIRASGDSEAESRLWQNLTRYGVAPTDPNMRRRIVAIAGDLSLHHLGLEPDRWSWLAEHTQIIYHSAAEVNAVLPYAVVRAPNVGGTLTLLRLACEGNWVRPFHFVSTLSVFPSHEAGMLTGVAFEQDDLSGYEAILDAGYPQSKWVAEKLVHQAGARGLPTCIFRAGVITGHSQTGATNSADLLSRQLKSMVELASVPRDGDVLRPTPVDYVAQATVALSSQETALGKTFHLSNSETLTGPELAEALRRHGYPIELVSTDEWRGRIEHAAQRNPEHSLYAVLSVLDSVTGKSPAYDCRHTLAGLQATGIVCPSVSDDLMKCYFDWFVATGVFPPPRSVA